MTELDKVAEAIYAKHTWMYPVTPDIALSLASSQLDGQGLTTIRTVSDKLFAMNSLDRTPKPINWSAEVKAIPVKEPASYIPTGTLTDRVATDKRKYYIDQNRYHSRTWLPGMLPVPTDGRWQEVESAVYDDFQKVVKLASTAALKKARS